MREMSFIYKVESDNDELLDWLFSIKRANTQELRCMISLLPTELIFRIFDFLPISQLYRIGKASTGFRQIVQRYYLFDDIIKQVKSVKGDSYALCLKYSKQICELCGYLAPKDAIGSSTCLPVITSDMVLSLCLPCRRVHYKHHPEPNRPLPERLNLIEQDQHLRNYSLPIFTAMIEYALTRQDLSILKHVIHTNSSIHHFIESEVVDLARFIHGGDIGIYQEIASSLLRYRIHSYQSCSRDRARRKLILEKSQAKKIRFFPESTVFIDYVLFNKGSVRAVLDDFEKFDFLYRHGSCHLSDIKKMENQIIRKYMMKRFQQGNYTSAYEESPESLVETLEKERSYLLKQEMTERLVQSLKYLRHQESVSREQLLNLINGSTESCSTLLSDAMGIKVEHMKPMIELSTCFSLLKPLFF